MLSHVAIQETDERARFRTLTHAVKHRVYLFVAIAAAVTVIAGVVAMVRPPSYRATVVLSIDERFVSPQSFNISLQTGQPLVDHFIQAASSRAVLARACSGSYFDTPATRGLTCSVSRLAGSVAASAADTPGWVSVTVSAGTAVQAAGFANAVAQAMVDQSKADDAQLVAPIREYLTSELSRLGGQITSEEATLQQLQGEPNQAAAITTHQNSLKLLQTQYLATAGRLQDLDIIQRRLDETLNVAQPAVPPAVAYDPDPARYIGAGLVAGLCIALAVVLVVDRLDDRLFDPESLAAAAGTRLAIAVAARDSESLTIHASNPYAVARTHLQATHPNLAKFMIVGASSIENLQPIAAGLGAAAARAGQRVLVLDADTPALVMQQQTSRSGSAMTVVSSPDAARSAAGDGPPAASDYDLVITLAPPPDANPIAISLARSGEVAIVVATARITRFSQVKRTAETLRLAGIDVAAAILSIDAPKEAPAVEEPGDGPSYSGMRGAAAGHARLPTWRGPGA